MGICRHCGYPSVLRDVKFCPECGKPFPVALDDPATWRTTKKTGTCRICGYEPVAFEAPTCPSCGGKSPNPGTISRFTGRGAWIGFLLLGGGCALGGFLDKGNAGAGFVGLIAGTLPGLVLGMLLGQFIGGIVAGMRNE